ncbi:MAG: Gfo/Idh/MocA family oxidoreductase [Saprospiraceae bacterium]|nr:Gfo/Idh/MocA family oxidoreductase [Saprospiraceae bacterium]
MKRRTFLKTSTLAATGLVTPQHFVKADDKIKLGILGTGWWARDFLINYAIPTNEFDIIGICDVNQKAMDMALEKIATLGGKKPAVFKDYHELLNMPDLQAVVIATPTHWHALQFIEACEKGLDIWQEKPLGYDIREMQAMEKAYKKAKNIVSIDFPRLYGPVNNEVKDYIQSGQAGEIRAIQFNIHSGDGTAPVTDVPSYLNYEDFCGPAPLLPYTCYPQGIGSAWRGQHGFSRGILADWGIHYLENIRQIMDLDLPDSISGIASFNVPGAEHPGLQEVIFDFQGRPVQWSHKGWGYSNPLSHTNMGVFYQGSKGTIFATDLGWEVYPSDGSGVKEYGGPKLGYGAPEFMAGVQMAFDLQFKHFAQAIRDRDDREILGKFDDGLKATAAVTYADMATRTQAPVVIDHSNLSIKDNAQAGAQLLRSYRSPYSHPYEG